MTANEAKKIRKSTGLTQSEFAERLNVSHKTVKAWEQGVNKIPGYQVNNILLTVKEIK